MIDILFKGTKGYLTILLSTCAKLICSRSALGWLISAPLNHFFFPPCRSDPALAVHLSAFSLRLQHNSHSRLCARSFPSRSLSGGLIVYFSNMPIHSHYIHSLLLKMVFHTAHTHTHTLTHLLKIHSGPALLKAACVHAHMTQGRQKFSII